jgi:hypothetical protein
MSDNQSKSLSFARDAIWVFAFMTMLGIHQSVVPHNFGGHVLTNLKYNCSLVMTVILVAPYMYNNATLSYQTSEENFPT